MLAGVEGVLVYLGLLILLLVALVIAYKFIKAVFERVVIFEYERGLRYQKGKFAGILQPGVYCFSRLNNLIIKADVRPTYLTIPGQEILSEGNIPVKISLLARLRVFDLEKAYIKTDDWQGTVYLLLQLALRRSVALLALDEILKNRGDLAHKLLTENAEPLAELGIELLSVDLKDIMLSAEIKRAYAQVLLAKQEGIAALEKARGETAALRSLANAAKMLENNPALYQLRLLHSISEAKASTLVLGTQGLIPRSVNNGQD